MSNQISENKLLMLFNDVNNIILNNENYNKLTGNSFNLFNILNDSTDEVKICKFIYELLNPNGSHYQGNKFLSLFFKYVLKIEITEQELSKANVYRELLLKDSKRRMDLVIETNTKFIPIEVKIYSGDQNKQLYDYYNDAKRHNKIVDKIYYLTLFGEDPSPESADLLDTDKIGLISFKNEIIQWIKECIKELSLIGVSNIEVILRQFLQILNILTNRAEEKIEMELEKLIVSSKDNLKACVEIERTISRAKYGMIIKFFNLLAKKLESNGINRIKGSEYDFDTNDYSRCKQFYDTKKSTYPGINIPFKNKGEDGLNYDIWVRIEINDNLFVGYCVPVNNNYVREEKPKEEIIKSLTKFDSSLFESYKYGWWTYWEYVYRNNKVINFKNIDDNFYDLVDDNILEQVVDETIMIVKKYLLIK